METQIPVQLRKVSKTTQAPYVDTNIPEKTEYSLTVTVHHSNGAKEEIHYYGSTDDARAVPLVISDANT